MENVCIPPKLRKEYPDLERTVGQLPIKSHPVTKFHLKPNGPSSFVIAPEVAVSYYNISGGGYGSVSASPTKLNVVMHLEAQPPIMLFHLRYSPEHS